MKNPLNGGSTFTISAHLRLLSPLASEACRTNMFSLIFCRIAPRRCEHLPSTHYVRFYWFRFTKIKVPAGAPVGVGNEKQTTSSVVAVIADRTAYDVRYTCKLYIKPVSVTSLRTARSHDPIQRAERTQTQSTQAWPFSVSVVYE